MGRIESVGTVDGSACVTGPVPTSEDVLCLEGTLDASAYCRIHREVSAACGSTRLVLDLRGVRSWEPLALAALSGLLALASGSVRVRGSLGVPNPVSSWRAG